MKENDHGVKKKLVVKAIALFNELKKLDTNLKLPKLHNMPTKQITGLIGQYTSELKRRKNV